MKKKLLTDQEVEAKLFALADSSPHYDRERMKRIIIHSLREKHAELMRRRRRAHWVAGGLASACILACACLLLPEEQAGNTMAEARPTSTTPLASTLTSRATLSQLNTPSSRGFTLDLVPNAAGVRRSRGSQRACYALTLKATPF